MKYEFRIAATCNMCGSSEHEMLGMRLGTSQGLNPKRAEGVAVPVKRCARCGLVFAGMQPVPEDLSDHYGVPPEDYWHHVPEPSPDYFAEQIATAKRLLGFRDGMTALDIGAGTGSAMRNLAAAGFDTEGIEPSEPFRAHAIAANGIAPDRLHLASIEDADFAPDSFDFITFGAVLEHLYDPRAALDKAMGWLRPGGIIQAEVPSSDWLISKIVNAFYRLRGTNYVTHISPMHSPFHLYEFTPRSFADYEIAEAHYDVGSQPNMPAAVQPLLHWWMKRSGRGMQLTVYLRKPHAATS